MSNESGNGALARKGRGARDRRPGRYTTVDSEPVDDGWGSLEALAESPLHTQVDAEQARRVIATNDSPDLPFDRAVNPYRGCEHGCIYCFARPSHAYLGLSPGLDFETRLTAKTNAALALARELGHSGPFEAPLILGANTDPYQPIERRYRLTRALLEVCQAHAQAVVIVTKGRLVLRDLDLLAPMAQAAGARVMVSMTTLDVELARHMEPRAASPAARLEVLRQVRAAGVPCGVLASPMIPGLNDDALEAILGAAVAAGADRAGIALLRLPHELKGLFVDWLEQHYPDRAAKVLGLLRECRGGALNDARFGTRLRGQGPYAELLAQRFRLALRRLGLESHHPTSQG